MSFPLNGFRMGTQAVNGTQSSKTVRSNEDWPNWSDTEEAEKDKSQSVQISIQPAGVPAQDCSAISIETGNDSEEPWDDFEDSEVSSDQTPSSHLPVSVPKTSTKNTPSEPTAGPQKSSKALKLNSSVKSRPDHNRTSWDTGWEQGTDTIKPSTSLASEPKPKSTIKSHGGLGEEFTIAVKKKPEQDPELDFFADMVPDIKLSSTSLLLPVESSISEPITATTLGHTASNNADLSIDALKLASKFAAADLTEVSLSACLRLVYVVS